MKFPSLLKIPTHKRFSIQPRYYDPIKEDIEYRTYRIKKMMEIKEKMSKEGDGTYESKILGSFSRESIHIKKNTGALRFSIMIFLSAGALGYLFYGNVSLYVMIALLVGFFLYKRIRSV